MENNIEYSPEIEKVINEQNRECALFGSPECAYLNAENCSECAVGRLAPEKQEKTRAAI